MGLHPISNSMEKLIILRIISIVVFSFQALAFDEVKLNSAIEMDDLTTVQKIIESGEATVDQKIQAEPYGPNTPIVALAGRAAALKVLKYLIENKADLNARTRLEETALMLAAFFEDEDGQMQPGYVRHEKAVQMLVEAGAEVENLPNKYTALSYAAYQGHDRIVLYLLKNGANSDGGIADGKAEVNTPLMMSSINGNLESTLWLLRHGADAKIVNAKGKTALMLAKQFAQKKMIPFLMCAELLQEGETFSKKCEKQ